jgi:hypothetical protein
MSQVMLQFTVRNPRNGDEFTFLGQGEHVKEAFDEGFKNCGTMFHANSSGKVWPEQGIALVTKDGYLPNGTIKIFEKRMQESADHSADKPTEEAIDL